MKLNTVAVKVKTVKIGQRGLRQVVVGLPPDWLRDMQLKPGDSISICRTVHDDLVVRKEQP